MAPEADSIAATNNDKIVSDEENLIEQEEKNEANLEVEEQEDKEKPDLSPLSLAPLSPSFRSSLHRQPYSTKTSSSSWCATLVSLWSHERCVATAVGCLSSCAVLVIRLLLDHEPTAYLIHSIVVFLDMILIHIFTKTLWLSISGEIVTILCFLAFHFTKETVYELFETTLLAALCSFHLIAARKKVKQERNELAEEVEHLRHRGAIVLRNIDKVQQVLADEDDLEAISNRTHDDVSEASTLESFHQHHHDEEEDEQKHQQLENPEDTENELTEELLHAGKLHQWFDDHEDQHHPASKVRWLGNTIFEYFLDGSAGVMYTSFLGLIIDELISYGSGKPY